MEKLKEYLTKKEIIILIIAVVILLLSSFSYAIFYSTDTRDQDIVTIECFKTTFEDSNDIYLDKAYPMSEAEGNQLTPYVFTLKNLCNKASEYQVNIETKEESSLSTSYLRYKLNNYSSDILGNQLEVFEYVNQNIKESRNIEAGVLLPNEEKTYLLRLWVDEGSTVSQSANKLYNSKVVIKTIENREPYQTIALNPSGGQVEHSEIVRVKKRKIGSIDEPERIGYFFEDWFSDASFTNRVSEDTIVTSEMNTLYAKWVPREDTEYRVEHYQMDIQGNYSSTPYETEVLQGTTDTSVTPSVKNYEHFIAPAAQTVNVDADGSQVVKYYYERVKYKQRVQGRYMDTSGTYGSYTDIASSEQDVYYGATYSYSQAETVEYKAATPSISYTVTGEKLDNQVSFERRKYTQKVQARYMNIAGNYGSYSDVSGKTIDYYYGATVPAYNVAATTEYKAASVAAYTVTGEATKQMSFERNKYRITYNANGGSVSPTYVDVYYNASTTLPTPTRSSYSVTGWYTATSGGTKYGNAGASYTVTAAKTMYAQWVTTVTNFSYSGTIKTFTVPATGTYKLEAWGAQGGNSLADNVEKATGGYGGYAVGNMTLASGTKIYVVVGGKGGLGTISGCSTGGYNGGGRGTNDGYTSSTACGAAHDDEAAGGGGGATHMALDSGLLSTLSSHKSDNRILIVAGGGGGGAYNKSGGVGGGYQGGVGGDTRAATQSSGYSFGKGEDASGAGYSNGVAGGGGGYYGGYKGKGSSDTEDDMAGGGSGYIGNSNLTNKHMTCYNCATSTATNTKTQSTTCHNVSLTVDCANEGNGYARITFVAP